MAFNPNGPQPIQPGTPGTPLQPLQPIQGPPRPVISPPTTVPTPQNPIARRISPTMVQLMDGTIIPLADPANAIPTQGSAPYNPGQPPPGTLAPPTPPGVPGRPGAPQAPWAPRPIGPTGIPFDAPGWNDTTGWVVETMPDGTQRFGPPRGAAPGVQQQAQANATLGGLAGTPPTPPVGTPPTAGGTNQTIAGGGGSAALPGAPVIPFGTQPTAGGVPPAPPTTDVPAPGGTVPQGGVIPRSPLGAGGTQEGNWSNGEYNVVAPHVQAQVDRLAAKGITPADLSLPQHQTSGVGRRLARLVARGGVMPGAAGGAAGGAASPWTGDVRPGTTSVPSIAPPPNGPVAQGPQGPSTPLLPSGTYLGNGEPGSPTGGGIVPAPPATNIPAQGGAPPPVAAQPQAPLAPPAAQAQAALQRLGPAPPYVPSPSMLAGGTWTPGGLGQAPVLPSYQPSGTFLDNKGRVRRGRR